MQALIATSRSISQDKFIERENKRKYEQHVKKVQSITGQKFYKGDDEFKESQKLMKTLSKAKEKAKSFRETQTKTQLKKQNRILLEKIWKINSNIKNDSELSHLQHHSGSNWSLKKRQADSIKQENKRLAFCILSSKVDAKQYKKKLGSEIKEYLDLRKNIRKCNYNTENNKDKIQRATSEKVIMSLKLKNQLEKDKNQQTIQPEVSTKNKDLKNRKSISSIKLIKKNRGDQNEQKNQTIENKTNQIS